MKATATFRVSYMNVDRGDAFAKARECKASESLVSRLIDGMSLDDDETYHGAVTVNGSEELVTVLGVLSQAHAYDISVGVTITSDIGHASATLFDGNRTEPVASIYPPESASGVTSEIKSLVDSISGELCRLKELALAARGGK